MVKSQQISKRARLNIQTLNRLYMIVWIMNEWNDRIIIHYANIIKIPIIRDQTTGKLDRKAMALLTTKYWEENE